MWTHQSLHLPEGTMKPSSLAAERGTVKSLWLCEVTLLFIMYEVGLQKTLTRLLLSKRTHQAVIVWFKRGTRERQLKMVPGPRERRGWGRLVSVPTICQFRDWLYRASHWIYLVQISQYELEDDLFLNFHWEYMEPIFIFKGSWFCFLLNLFFLCVYIFEWPFKIFK